MTTTASSAPFWAAYRATVYGGLLAGALDLAAAIISGLVRGTAPQTIMQSIASGLLGRDAFVGGTTTAALGVALHFAIMLVIAGVYVVSSRRLPARFLHLWLAAPLYGVAVYFFMSAVVVPLSAAPFSISYTPDRLAIGLLVHVFCVGLPIAFMAAFMARRNR